MTLVLISSVCLPGGEVLVSRRVPTEDHPCNCEDVFLHRQSHEDTTAAAGRCDKTLNALKGSEKHQLLFVLTLFLRLSVSDGAVHSVSE